MSELTRLPASVLREQIAARKISPVELTDAVLARAEQLQPEGWLSHSRTIPAVA